MINHLEQLKAEGTLVILAYADAGLGHLRVTNALFEGLPKEINPILLRSQEGSIRFMHRLTSTNPLLRRLMEWSQRGRQEELITKLYIRLLNLRTKPIQIHLEEILEQQMHVASRVVIVSTHFGLAHQLAQMKPKIKEKWNINVTLAIYVTDDSPQPIWYVPGADLIAVPSLTTKRKLLEYAKRNRLPETTVKVIPYPVSPVIGKRLSLEEFDQKKNQVSPDKGDLVNVSVPVSGAAVGLDFANKLMAALHNSNNRFVFNVTTQDNVFTREFILLNQKKDYVTVLESAHPRRVVRLYDKMFINSILSMEITKPSEQAFKALFNPHQRGGVILLFTNPVGRQEYDNLDYLRRNNYIPSIAEHGKLYAFAHENQKFSDKAQSQLKERAKRWSGLILPRGPQEAAQFVNWCLANEIFLGMMANKKDKSEGVKQFWKSVDSKLQ